MCEHPRGGACCRGFRTRGLTVERRTCQAHRDAHFLRQALSERGQCAKTVRILGLDGESAGGKGQEVTLGLAGGVGLCRLMWFYCMERGGLGDWICLTGADFAISRKICSYYSEH